MPYIPGQTFCLEVTGDYACFTMPECKVERVSYPIITPSAARGIFDAIYWHPPIKWEVRKIEVLAPVRWLNIKRNEVACRAGERVDDVYCNDNRYRQQRAARILKDVAYRLHARLMYDQYAYKKPKTVTHPGRNYVTVEPDTLAKHEEIFADRAMRGKCFMHPYLGCREFSVKSFKFIDNPARAAILRPPVDLPYDVLSMVTYMLYDMDFSGEKPKPMIFRPKISHGVIDVPPMDSEEIWR